jgi:drug/metabolite transporter (DMT)-like permease
VAILWGLDSFNVVKLIAVVLIFSGVMLVNKSRAAEHR